MISFCDAAVAFDVGCFTTNFFLSFFFGLIHSNHVLSIQFAHSLTHILCATFFVVTNFVDNLHLFTFSEPFFFFFVFTRKFHSLTLLIRVFYTIFSFGSPRKFDFVDAFCFFCLINKKKPTPQLRPSIVTQVNNETSLCDQLFARQFGV